MRGIAGECLDYTLPHPQHLVSTEKWGTALCLGFLPVFKEMLPHLCSTPGIKDLKKITGPAKVRGSFAIGFTKAKMHHSSDHTPKKPLLEAN